jgi:hypothetical protein
LLKNECPNYNVVCKKNDSGCVKKKPLKNGRKEFETVTFWVTLKVKLADSITDFILIKDIDVLTML